MREPFRSISVFLAAVVLSVGMSSAFFIAFPDKQKVIVRTWLDSMRDQGYLIKADDYTSGSGVHIGNGYILTAYHVVSGDKDGVVDIFGYDGYLSLTLKYSGVVLKHDEDIDIAVLFVEELKSSRGIALGDYGEDLDINNLIFTLGCPDGSFPPSLSAGIVKAEGYNQVLIDAGVWYGRSGGALISARTGRLLGIVVEIGFRKDQAWNFSSTPYTNLGICVHIDRIEEKLEEWELQFSP